MDQAKITDSQLRETCEGNLQQLDEARFAVRLRSKADTKGRHDAQASHWNTADDLMKSPGSLGGAETTTSGSAPSAVGLPFQEPVDLYDRSLQITGDLAVLTVVDANDDGDAIGPEYPPKWTAVRVVRLR